MIAESWRTTFRSIFCHWFVVAVSCYLLVLLPFLVVPRDIMPITEQLIGHALIIAAMMIVSVLWSSLLTALVRALSFVARSPGAREHVMRSSASIALSLFICLVLVFGWSAVGGGDPHRAVILDLLLANRFMGITLGVLIVLFHLAPATRLEKHLEEAFARMRRLGAFLAWCTLPFILVFLFQAIRVALPPEKAQTAHRLTRVPSNIVVIVLDALPMEKTSFALKGEDLTPSLRRFAEKSFLFTRAYSAANVTSPSVATLLTGKYPVNHGIFEVKMSLPRSSRKEGLPIELQKAGFATGAIVANFEVHPRLTKLEGFDRVFPMRGRGWIPWMASAALRFADFNLGNLWSFSLEGWFLLHVPDHSRLHPWPPERNFSDGLTFLSDGNKPRFAYIHVMPPHSPYLADPPYMYSRLPVEGFMDTPSSHEIELFRSYPESEREPIGMLEKRYEETVLSVDHQLGRFLDGLEAAGRFEDTIIVVLSDHGEMFEPRWVAHHGPYLDDALVHVPLLIHLPGQKIRQAVDAPIGLVDVAPTLLDLEGLSIPQWMDGVSWKPVFSGGSAPDRPAYSVTSEAILSIVKGRASEGSCRMTRGSSRAVLDLAEKKVVLAEPAGNRIVFFGDPKDTGPGAGSGLNSFEDAVRYFCPTKSSKGADRAVSTAP